MTSVSKMSDPVSVERRLAFQKSYSVEHGQSWRRKSLIEDAKFDTASNAEYSKRDRESISEESEGDDVTTSTSAVLHPTEEVKQFNMIVSLKEGLVSLYKILKYFENYSVLISHMESRVPQSQAVLVEVLLQCQARRHCMIPLVNALKSNHTIAEVKVTQEDGKDDMIWFPTHISDLDHCHHLMTKFEPELDIDHPGFTDMEYRKRRQILADVAFHYRHGDPIPLAEYTESEVQTWGVVYRKLKELFHTHACREHIRMFDVLEKEGGYTDTAIPQLEDVSNFLKRKTGFTLRPVAGLLTARDFLASLAFRVFQCTQYVRHPSKPHHSPEPDCIHELLGHAPMLSNPSFAQFSQDLGLASLGASDEDMEKFATLYWFTVEFGLLKQDGIQRAFGAGILSSYGELLHALSDTPEKRPFDAFKAAVQDYRDEDYQPIYFIAESFDDMQERTRAYAATIKRPYELRYNPFNQSVTILDKKVVIQDTISDLKREISFVEQAMRRVSNIDISK